MFSNWQQEKATAALVDAAQAHADRLATAKKHIIDSQAATAWFWAASYLSDGLNLYQLASWKPVAAKRFASATATRIDLLRKQRAYDSSDGLAIWMHTARAVCEPRIAPAARDIWRQLAQAGPNADSMAEDLLQDAGLPINHLRQIPSGFENVD